VSIIPIELSTKFIALVQSVGKISGKLLTLFIMSIIKGVTNGKIHLYFLESSGTVYFPIALLIIVLYRQNHRRVEKSLVLFGEFMKKFN
jgi:hypothetical protein